MGGLIFLVLMVGAGWLLLVRPQQQRLRAQRTLIDSLRVGEEVVTAGGMIGTIVGLDERDVRLEVAPGTVLTFLRPAISRKLGANEAEGLGDGAVDEGAMGDGYAQEGTAIQGDGLTGADGATAVGSGAGGSVGARDSEATDATTGAGDDMEQGA